MNGLTPTRTPEEILGLDPVDPRALHADPELRARHEARLRAAYLQRRREELIEEFHEAGLGAEAVGPMAEVFSHPSSWRTGWRQPSRTPSSGSTTQVGVPAVLRGTPGAIQGGQPRAGAHSREVVGRKRNIPRPRSTVCSTQGSWRTCRGSVDRCGRPRPRPVSGRALRSDGPRGLGGRGHQGGARPR